MLLVGLVFLITFPKLQDASISGSSSLESFETFDENNNFSFNCNGLQVTPICHLYNGPSTLESVPYPSSDVSSIATPIKFLFDTLNKGLSTLESVPYPSSDLSSSTTSINSLPDTPYNATSTIESVPYLSSELSISSESDCMDMENSGNHNQSFSIPSLVQIESSLTENQLYLRPPSPQLTYYQPHDHNLSEIDLSELSGNVINFKSGLSGFIATEILSYSIENRSIIRNLISLIASNDYASFLINRKSYTKAFGADLSGLTKNFVPFLPYYIIKFGATNFLRLLKNFSYSEFFTMKLMSAFIDFIRSGNKTDLLAIINECDWIPESAQKVIGHLVSGKYPVFSNFDLLFFESPRSNESIKKCLFEIINTNNEQQKLKVVFKFLELHTTLDDEILNHFSFNRLLQIPLQYKDEFLSLPLETKVLLGKIAIIHGTIDDLKNIVERCCMTDNITLELFEFVIKLRKSEFISLMIRLYGDYLFILNQNKSLCLYEMILKADDVETIKILENFGLDSENVYINDKNAFQLAFDFGSVDLSKYFIGKYSSSTVLTYLLESYENGLNIVSTARQNFNEIFVIYLIMKLGLKL